MMMRKKTELNRNQRKLIGAMHPVAKSLHKLHIIFHQSFRQITSDSFIAVHFSLENILI